MSCTYHFQLSMRRKLYHKSEFLLIFSYSAMFILIKISLSELLLVNTEVFLNQTEKAKISYYVHLYSNSPK